MTYEEIKITLRNFIDWYSPNKETNEELTKMWFIIRRDISMFYDTINFLQKTLREHNIRIDETVEKRISELMEQYE